MFAAYRLRLILVVVCVAALAMLGTDRLVTRHFESALQEVNQSRFRFELDTLHAVLGRRMALGLPVSDDSSLRSRLSEVAEQTPEIIAIEIFDIEGIVMLSTDTSFEGDLVSLAWLDMVDRVRGSVATEEVWIVREGFVNTIGRPFRNSVGETVGSIVLTYRLDGKRTTLDGYRWTLVQDAGILLTVTLFLAGLVVFVALQPLAGSLAGMGERLKRLTATDRPTPNDGASDTPAGQTVRDVAFLATETAIIRALDRIGETAEQLRRMDRDE